jgi:hypothetical protein
MEVIWGNRLKPDDHKYIGGFPKFVAHAGDDRVGKWLDEKIQPTESLFALELHPRKTRPIEFGPSGANPRPAPTRRSKTSKFWVQPDQQPDPAHMTPSPNRRVRTRKPAILCTGGSTEIRGKPGWTSACSSPPICCADRNRSVRHSF